MNCVCGGELNPFFKLLPDDVRKLHRICEDEWLRESESSGL